jgi:hypothetical protein
MGPTVVGSMTRESVRPQHLLGTLRSPGPNDIITIDDFLLCPLYALTCDYAHGGAKSEAHVVNP